MYQVRLILSCLKQFKYTKKKKKIWRTNNTKANKGYVCFCYFLEKECEPLSPKIWLYLLALLGDIQ